jgi:hypothetical protein
MMKQNIRNGNTPKQVVESKWKAFIDDDSALQGGG